VRAIGVAMATLLVLLVAAPARADVTSDASDPSAAQPHIPREVTPRASQPGWRHNSNRMVIGGIVTAGIGASMTALAVAVLANPANDEDKCSSYEGANCRVWSGFIHDMAYGGLALGLSGIGTGVVLILVGRKHVPAPPDSAEGAQATLLIGPGALAIRGNW
jgi:hypothetical protein